MSDGLLMGTSGDWGMWWAIFSPVLLFVSACIWFAYHVQNNHLTNANRRLEDYCRKCRLDWSHEIAANEELKIQVMGLKREAAKAEGDIGNLRSQNAEIDRSNRALLDIAAATDVRLAEFAKRLQTEELANDENCKRIEELSTKANELSRQREEALRLLGDARLTVVRQQQDALGTLAKLSAAERGIADLKHRLTELDDENTKLRMLAKGGQKKSTASDKANVAGSQTKTKAKHRG